MSSPKKQLPADNNKKANSRPFSNMANRYDNKVKVTFAWYMYILGNDDNSFERGTKATFHQEYGFVS